MRGESVRGRGSGRRSQSRRWWRRTRRRTRWARGGAVGRAMMRFGFAFLRLAFTDCEFGLGFEIWGLRFDGNFRSNFNGARLKGKSRRPLQRQRRRLAGSIKLSRPLQRQRRRTNSEPWPTFIFPRSATPRPANFPEFCDRARWLGQDLGRLPMPLARSEMELLTNSRWPWL